MIQEGGYMRYTILVVEDQKEIRDIVMRYLAKEGHHVLCASNGLEALEIYQREKIHLLILDVMMPGIDGFEVLKTLRAVTDMPVIMLTARVGEEDRIFGFDLGADDYVIKPFSVRELVRRVSALLRRVYVTAERQALVFDELKLDLGQMTLYRGAEEIPLTTYEFQLIKTFFEHPGQILSREQLIEAALGEDYDGFDRNIDSYVKRLRQKIEVDPKHPRWLTTKYGAGYCFGGQYDIT
jgi:DNA-binding response OmpR family regulator